MTHIQYLSIEGKDRIPSKKEKSVGLKLREALEKAKLNLPIIIPKRTPEQAFYDFIHDNDQKLRYSGLLSFAIENIKEDVLGILVVVSGIDNESSQKYTKNKVVEIFKNTLEFKIGNINVSIHNFVEI